MVREWYMRRGLHPLGGEWAFGEVNPPSFQNHLMAAGMSHHLEAQLDASTCVQKIQQILFNFVVTCR